MGADDGFIGVVGGPDIHGGEILSVAEDGDTILVTVRRTLHRGREARGSAPHIEVRFHHVKDVEARTLDETPPGTYEICRVCGWQDDRSSRTIRARSDR